MHIKLPRDLLDELEKISTTERTKGVVAHHYAQSTIPNPPTDYLVCLLYTSDAADDLRDV